MSWEKKEGIGVRQGKSDHKIPYVYMILSLLFKLNLKVLPNTECVSNFIV